MAIVVNLDVMMAKRKMTLSQLSEKVDITLANLSILKTTRPRRALFHPGGHLLPPGLPARRYSGIRTVREAKSPSGPISEILSVLCGQPS